ncbi:sensor histidine kinase [Vibrio coralliilyticus]|uniref:sensor histidine kinase n=1 Tax=Vibrio coralliilyticus TaxID=190893 RepID=UPI00148C5FF5|nr:HAMP domain-containing sensor histidine kinase [Vibrio coralliilyticus]NOI30210.1 HAMP domain-containing histidine kinase [Vibrio coralliilyticus]NOI46816.1 HAMP domain-containing histidine kinase [Vibrio coralliilyticus]
MSNVNRVLSSTRSLTGRLALFFTTISCIIGVVIFLIFTLSLQWSEDRVGERRILIDRDEAVARFIAGEDGEIQIDALTRAYNDLSLVPDFYRKYTDTYDTYLGEVGSTLSPNGHMVYKGYYTDKGEKKVVVLLSLIDQVEFATDEFIYSGVIVISFVSVLMFLFGTLLYRLSTRLIEPVNEIAKQLESHSGSATQAFTIREGAADEFQALTEQLNQYRQDLNLALKREQAFARYASHELRTPLTVVKGANKLLSRSEHSEFQERQISRIEDATTQMTTMVDALLSIVRYERNVDDAPLRGIEEAELQSIVDANSVQATEKNIAIRLTIEGLPTVRATPAVMNMILGNLIRNAIAATAEGEITIDVSEQQLVIIDDGPGLSETPNVDGHGLGLLIVDDLSQRYGWSFELGNHPRRGCSARILF